MRCDPVCRSTIRGAGGFTLIEVLVVLVIIAIASGFAVLSLHTGSESGARGAADGFSAALDAVALDSLTGAHQYGVKVWEEGYAFVHLNNKGKWVQANLSQAGANGVGAKHTLANGVRARLSIGGEAVKLSLSEEDSPPQILILSNGEMTAFKIVFDSDRPEDEGVQVTADAVGHLSTSDVDSNAQQ